MLLSIPVPGTMRNLPLIPFNPPHDASSVTHPVWFDRLSSRFTVPEGALARLSIQTDTHAEIFFEGALGFYRRPLAVSTAIFLMGCLMHDRDGNLFRINGLEDGFHEGHDNPTLVAKGLAEDSDVRLLGRNDIDVFDGANVLRHVVEPTGTGQDVGVFFA